MIFNPFLIKRDSDHTTQKDHVSKLRKCDGNWKMILVLIKYCIEEKFLKRVNLIEKEIKNIFLKIMNNNK